MKRLNLVIEKLSHDKITFKILKFSEILEINYIENNRFELITSEIISQELKVLPGTEVIKHRTEEYFLFELNDDIPCNLQYVKQILKDNKRFLLFRKI